MHERQQKHNHFDEDDKIKLTSKATAYNDNKAKKYEQNRNHSVTHFVIKAS